MNTEKLWNDKFKVISRIAIVMYLKALYLRLFRGEEEINKIRLYGHRLFDQHSNKGQLLAVR